MELYDSLVNIISPYTVAGSFNEYFSKMGVNVNTNIPPSNVTPIHYMNINTS